MYYEVECSGEIIESDNGDGMFVCTEIKLIKEIPAPENKFEECWSSYNGFAVVWLNDKYNFIDTKGKYLSEQWFDNCDSFHNCCARVWLNGKCNFLNTDGKLISKQWFDRCGNFYNGYVNVELNGIYYIIDKNGKLMEE